MLEKPEIEDHRIISALENSYDLTVIRLSFLPLSADLNTVVYQIISDKKATFFLKLRKGDFNENSVLLPRFLYTQGLNSIIAPLPTRADELWVNIGEYKLILYPFVEGRDGYELELTERQWLLFASKSSLPPLAARTGSRDICISQAIFCPITRLRSL